MIIVKNGKSHIVSKEYLDRQRKQPQVIKNIKNKMVFEKRHYESYEVIYRHRVELGAMTPKEYLRRMKEIESEMKRSIGKHEKELKSLYKPNIKYNNKLSKYVCSNHLFKTSYGLVLMGISGCVDVAYQDWCEEMIIHGYLEDI